MNEKIETRVSLADVDTILDGLTLLALLKDRGLYAGTGSDPSDLVDKLRGVSYGQRSIRAIAHENQDLRDELKTLSEAVRRMRDLQRAYFKNRSPSDLQASKAAEARVDKLASLQGELL